MRRTLALTLALLAVLPVGAAAGAPVRTTLYEVEKDLMCDTCNVPLNVAESARADQERAEIRDLIAQGKTKREILDIFVAQYGSKVLAVPRGGGASITVWAVPAGIIAAVALGLLLLLPRWRRRRPSPAADPGPDLDAADAERLARDLAGYDV